MALARLLSRGQRGMDAYEVIAEVYLTGGLPSFTISGLPAAAVRDSRDRVRAALQTLGSPIPPSRITAHLGPADIPKEGGRFDLAIAIGVLMADKGHSWQTDEAEFIGELALSGELRPVQGALPAVLAARDAGRAVIIPAGNAPEAALVDDAMILPVSELADVIAHLDGSATLKPVPRAEAPCGLNGAPELADVHGQTLGRNRLEETAVQGAPSQRLVGHTRRWGQPATARRDFTGASRRPVSGRAT